MLDAGYREEWVRMVAWAYSLNGDWERTQTRLLNLPEVEVRNTATDVLERAANEGHSIEILQRLAELAAAYGASSPGVAIYAQGGALPEPSPVGRASSTPRATETPRVPTPTATSRPTLTPTATPSSSLTDTVPVRVISQTLSCQSKPVVAVSLTLSRTIEVRGREVSEIVGQPMREFWLIWNEGADRAITGFRPDLGLGYADFNVEPGRAYNLYLDSPYGIPVSTFQVEPCPPDEGTGWVSRYLMVQEEVAPELEATATPTSTAQLDRVPVFTTTLTTTEPVTGSEGLIATPALTLTLPNP